MVVPIPSPSRSPLCSLTGMMLMACRNADDS